MKAVIVEDEAVIARDLADMLEETGYTVPPTAMSVEEALGRIDRHTPDVVLIDIVLEGDRDGVDLAHVVREKYKLPFLFITAHADHATVTRAKATRPNGYLVKPFSKDDVYAATEMALSHYAEEEDAAQQSEEKEPDEGEPRGLPPYRLEKIKAFVGEHLDENLTLAELAEVVDMSKYYFSRLFKQSTGVTPYRYIVRQRIDEAKRLLSGTDLLVAQIALRTGFGSPSHLSNTFKEHVSVSPSTYRNES